MTTLERKEYLEDLLKEAVGEFRSFREFTEENLREWLDEDNFPEEGRLTKDEFNNLVDDIHWYLYSGEEVA